MEQYSAQYNSRALFNWDSAAVTDPLGVPRTYTFGTFGGRRKTVSIVGPPCPSCGPPSTSYDDNGYAISTTDSNGNVTMRPVCAVALNLDDSMLANGINDIPGLWRGTTAAMVAGACSTAKAVHVRT